MPGKQRYRFLFLCDAFNSMCQRAMLRLEAQGHQVVVHIARSPAGMIQAAAVHDPDIILCPFLTRRIPSDLYRDTARPCWIVHPGIEGDRGMSSLDWALQGRSPVWGVTILQADDVMDAGPVWATTTFPVRPGATKSGTYRRECVDAAMACLDAALASFAGGGRPRPAAQDGPGRARPRMTQADRRIDWDAMSADEIARRVAAADSQPGLEAVLPGASAPVSLFNACVARDWRPSSSGPASGSLIALRDDAVLIACERGRSAVWIGTMRVGRNGIKVPARDALAAVTRDDDDAVTRPCRPVRASPGLFVEFGRAPDGFQEVYAWRHPRADDVVFLWFDFYNGAMSTRQCRRLCRALDNLLDGTSSPPPRVLVLMGGPGFFSNGINLNTIEASADPVAESADNIVAIDDVVERVLHATGTVTVSALMGNAGAGGAMMAIAADHVWAHANSVLLPSYANMALFGSEYWTYSLRRRVGPDLARSLALAGRPVSAHEAHRIGLVDRIVSDDAHGFVDAVADHAGDLAVDVEAFLRRKAAAAPAEQRRMRLCRRLELMHMYDCFRSDEYAARRRDFVYKSAAMPCRK
ncbi:Formyl transferase C-terminal domain-containing protein [Plasmodiophora brassicae]